MSSETVWPAANRETLPTLMFVAPGVEATANEVGPAVNVAAVVFSSSMFAVPTPPTSHPARVNGTHGAGVFFCPSVIMLGSGSLTASTTSFQYLNVDEKPIDPFDSK